MLFCCNCWDNSCCNISVFLCTASTSLSCGAPSVATWLCGVLLLSVSTFCAASYMDVVHVATLEAQCDKLVEAVQRNTEIIQQQLSKQLQGSSSTSVATGINQLLELRSARALPPAGRWLGLGTVQTLLAPSFHIFLKAWLVKSLSDLD